MQKNLTRKDNTVGDIGEPLWTREFEPMPATEPVQEPSPPPVPEKVPA
jgi:hypothetical protein